MNSNNFSVLGTRKNSNDKRKVITKLICIFFILIFFINFLSITNNTSQNNFPNAEITSTEKNNFDNNIENPELSAGDKLFQDPFTVNHSIMWDFFDNKYKSDLNYPMSTYFRYGDSEGNIVDDTVFSEDNLLLYKTLLKNKYDASAIQDIYGDLKDTPFWIQLNSSHYGFVRSIDNSTGEIIDDNRYLIENLMPIFLLIEKDDSLSNTNDVMDIFTLINSSQYWDATNKGFYEHDESISGEKYTKSNLYAILACILISRTNSYTDIKIDAFDKANQTMQILMDKMWDADYKGFYYKADSTWNPSGPGIINGEDKSLEVNALGIITLIEYWIETGMDDDSYLNKSKELYDIISKDSKNVGVNYGGLWNPTYNAYENCSGPLWGPPNLNYKKLDIESNALMMQACLKLFEITGNITYYDRAFQLFNFFESDTMGLFDSENNAYDTSTGYNPDDNKNFRNNLKLVEAYLEAYEIYSSTVLEASYNATEEIPNFIVDQDVMELNCTYLFKKTNKYYPDFTTKYNFSTDANITFIVIDPDDKIIGDPIEDYFDNTNVTTLIYKITENLPVDVGYSVYIQANTTKFGVAYTYKYFNVISGLEDKPIIGLKEFIHQGVTMNVTIPITSIRKDNITLNVSLEGNGIETFELNEIEFFNGTTTSVEFNITALKDAPSGFNKKLYFKFKNGSVVYLIIEEEIEIKYALDYSNLIYEKNVVSGGSFQVYFDLINTLSDEKQDVSIIFSGTYVNDEINTVILDEEETKKVSYNVDIEDDIDEDSIQIEMNITKGSTIIHSKLLTINVLPKLEIINVNFPEKVKQGSIAYLVIIIQNNQDDPEEFKLYINEKEVETDIDELIPGENRIEVELPVQNFYNPYEFGTKTYKIELEDSSGDVVSENYFEYELELSSFNLVVFYLIPIIIPIGIILLYKNKDIKNKLLRR